MSTHHFTLRCKDRLAFRDAATTYRCWILVRAINPASLPYLDDPRYTPKPIDCKPKTADADCRGKHLAGLVIVPALHGASAFRPGKFVKAVACWDSFLQARNVPTGRNGSPRSPEQGLEEAEALNRARGDYGVDLSLSSPHYGCLQFKQKWIHGDFDLKDIILEGQERRNLAAVEELRGQTHMRGPLFYRVSEFVNARLGKDMVQHGGEAQYADHSEDIIDVFGPRGQHTQLGTALEIREWYSRYEREVIDLKRGAARPVPDPGKSPEAYRAGFRVLPGGKGG